MHIWYISDRYRHDQPVQLSDMFKGILPSRGFSFILHPLWNGKIPEQHRFFYLSVLYSWNIPDWYWNAQCCQLYPVYHWYIPAKHRYGGVHPLWNGGIPKQHRFIFVCGLRIRNIPNWDRSDQCFQLYPVCFWYIPTKPWNVIVYLLWNWKIPKHHRFNHLSNLCSWNISNRHRDGQRFQLHAVYCWHVPGKHWHDFM